MNNKKVHFDQSLNTNANNDTSTNTDTGNDQINHTDISNQPNTPLQTFNIQTSQPNIPVLKNIPKRPNINLSANLFQIASQQLIFFDKSEDLNKLFSLGMNRILILRPPLFGKTVICDMIEALFSGKQSLLQSLKAKIANEWDFSKIYPIIRFSLKFYAKDFDEFYIHFTNVVSKLYTQFQIPKDIFSSFGVPQDEFAYLIQTLTKDGQKVVIIIEDIESCLIHLPFNEPTIPKIKLCIQQLFNYIANIKDSLAFLLITGVDNYYDLSNLCIDLTESPDVAGLFGITLKDIGQVDFFIPDNQIENNLNSFQFKNIIGSLQKLVYETFMHLRGEFLKSLKYISNTNKNGFIQLKYLQSILLNSGGNCFSPKSDITVSNYVDFLGMCYNGKTEHFWLEVIIKRETDSLPRDIMKLFQYYPNHLKMFDDVITNQLFNNIHTISPLFDTYRYLIRYGFFTYRGGKIFPTNFCVLSLLIGSSIDYFRTRISIDLHSWSNFQFKDVVISSFVNFYKTSKLPTVLKVNKCIEIILSIFLTSIYTNTHKLLMKDGSLVLYSPTLILKFVEITNTESFINCFACQETVYLIKISCIPEKGDFASFYYKNQSNAQIELFNIEIPQFYELKLLTNDNPYKIGFFSFEDIVLNVIFYSCWGKPEGINKFYISAEIMKKMPELSSDKTLDKKVSLALQLLCKNGKVKYYTHPEKKYVLYTLAKNLIPKATSNE